jgi:T4 RnlA family RNA ligase
MTTYKLPIADMVALKSKTALESEQAVAANEWLKKESNSSLHKFLTAMMDIGISVSLEWTAPQHRIVLPYQGSNLTVLCARHLNDATYVRYGNLRMLMEKYGCEKHLVANILDNIEPSRVVEFIENVPHMVDVEGYVVMLEGGQLVKIKTDWYCALHHTKDSVGSDRRLFECVVLE